MAKLKESDAVQAYQAIHALQQDKKEITKEQAEHKAIVKDYLAEHPEGFYVRLEDARGSSHDYHVAVAHTDRVTLDRASLRAKLMLILKGFGGSWYVPKTLTSAYLARMVEQGYLTADDIEGYEDVQESKSVKKTKAKGGRPQTVPTQEQEQGATMEVHRADGSVEVRRPQITTYDADGNGGTVTQEASTEKREPDDDRPLRTWNV